MKKRRTVAVIPAFNESKRIAPVITLTRTYVDEVIVIDDGSTDDTPKIAQKLCTVITQPRNMGKGKAIARGIQEALQRNADLIILIDADGEHDPRDIPRMLDATRDADLAVGRRERYRSAKRRALNSLGDYWFSYLIARDIDVHSGFRALKRELAQKMHLRSSGFEIEIEMLLEASYHKARITSVPITTHSSGKSGVSFRDYVRINNFFDSWVLARRKSLNIPQGKKIMLTAACATGLVVGRALERMVK